MGLRKLFFLIILISVLFISNTASAQYYYKDILSTNQLNDEYAILKNKQVKKITLKSFEDNDEPSEGFFCEKKMNKDYSLTEMISKSNITGQSTLLTNYNPEGKITKSTNTGSSTINTTEYEYNQTGKLTMIRTRTSSDTDSTGIEETHQYFYDDAGNLLKMLRKKNNNLLNTITFITDKNGNVIEELASSSQLDKKYYYYYDDQNRLTDVVHYNEIAKKLLPDYVFEYDQLKLPKQMLSVDESGRNYFIWRFAYDSNQLIEIQKCYSKDKKLLGTIEYEYQ